MKLFEAADLYCKESTWKTLSLLKICLFSAGLMAGMKVPKKQKTAVLAVSFGAFILSYLPLMAKFFTIWKKMPGQGIIR